MQEVRFGKFAEFARKEAIWAAKMFFGRFWIKPLLANLVLS